MLDRAVARLRIFAKAHVRSWRLQTSKRTFDPTDAVGHLLPSWQGTQHLRFTPANRNAGEPCTTGKKCQTLTVHRNKSARRKS